jgi:hypothetical protein
MNYFVSAFVLLIVILSGYQLFRKNVTHSNGLLPFKDMESANNVKTEDVVPIVETKHEIKYEEFNSLKLDDYKNEK